MAMTPNKSFKNDLAILQYCSISSRKQAKKLVTTKELRDAKNHNLERPLNKREAEAQSHTVQQGPLAPVTSTVGREKELLNLRGKKG